MRRMTKVLDLVLATVILAACGGSPVAQNGTATAPVTGSSGPHVVLPDGSSIAVEVVADPESRARGLMYRPSLAENRGMLFLFPAPDVHSFWMKDTLIPLDMIWLDTERRSIYQFRKVATSLARHGQFKWNAIRPEKCRIGVPAVQDCSKRRNIGGLWDLQPVVRSNESFYISLRKSTQDGNSTRGNAIA